MPADIVIGRSRRDTEKYKTKGTILLGKQYVQMGQSVSLSNMVHLDMTGSHVYFIVGKRGGGKCLTGDSLITLSDGRQVTIKHLEHAQGEVLALNQQLKIQPASRTEFFKREVEKLLQITLRSGKVLKITPEHPLLTIKGWMPAEQLSLGSRVAAPRKIDAFGNKDMSESEVKLIAYFITEGHLNNNFMLFCNTDQAIVGDLQKAVSDFDPLLKVKDHQNHGYRVVQNKKRKINAERSEKGTFVKVAVDAKSSIRLWAEKLQMYGNLSPKKVLPSEVFTLPRVKTSLLLNRMFSCDGYILREGPSYWKVGYSTSSELLARQVQHLLLRFGIVSFLRAKQTKCHPHFEIIIRGEHVTTYLNEVGFFGKKEGIAAQALSESISIIRNPKVDTVPQEIWDVYHPKSWVELGRKLNYTVPKSFSSSKKCSISRQKLALVAKAEESELLLTLANSDIYWDEIVGLKTLEGNFEVYDICVPEHHNFVANDVIVHNSYTMGVIAEGVARLDPEIRDNLSVILLDTMGVYWTMRYPNLQDAELLQQWGLEPKGLDVVIYTPSGFYKQFKEQGIPTDMPFSLQPSELTAEDWCEVFALDVNSSVGVAFSNLITKLREKATLYSIDDMGKVASTFEEMHTRNLLVNLLLKAKSWGIFETEGTDIRDLAKGGQITVMDLSVYATLPSGWLIKNLVVGLVAKNMFNQRMIARKTEEFSTIDASMHYFTRQFEEKLKEPLVWLIVDEAHEMLPAKGKTAATDALITILREGRQPGISLILATQQPGKIHTDVMTQADSVIAHRITAKIDTDALGALMQSYMREGLANQLDHLPRLKGSALAFDDANERLFQIQIRPRFTWHGGGSPSALREQIKRF